jgi:multidrug efflux pump subunit AcrB
MDDMKQRKGMLGWFASNHVAANLLMFLIIAAGLLTISTIKVEFFPELALDMITVSVPYLGASPTDVEEGVLLRVEEAIAAVDGIKRLNSSAAEGMGTVTVEVEEYVDVKDVLDDVKAEVGRIITFPKETEKPIIAETSSRYEVLTIVIYGDASEKSLKELADQVRDDLTAMDNISQVDVAGVRPYEISIEVSEENLRRYDLSFDQVSATVRQSSLDLPAGSVKTSGGEILVRTQGQKYSGPEFEKTILLTRNDGTRIRLGDIAAVKDAFEDTDLFSRFDGRRAALVKVFRVGEQGALDVAETVNKYVEQKRNSLPEGIAIATWQDQSVILRQRIDLLRRNAYLGLILVFLCLTLFLNIRLAFWTTIGIPISFLGAFWLMPRFDVSVNMISLFAFIMSLGLVVDDAIVVGENIFAHRQRGLDRMTAAIKGVKEMAAPVTMAVLTTVFAFFPLLYLGGIMGKIMRVIPIVVISVLMVSLVEALLILPAHLSAEKSRKKPRIFASMYKIHQWAGHRLQVLTGRPFSRRPVRPVKGLYLIVPVKWLYAVLTIALAVTVYAIGCTVNAYVTIGRCIIGLVDRIQTATARRLERFVKGPFARFVTFAVKWRYATLAVGLAFFLITTGFIRGGYIKFVFFDSIEADNMIATLTMPQGSPVRQTMEIADRLETAAEQVRREFDANRPGKPSLLKHVATTIGAHPSAGGRGPARDSAGAGGAHLAEVNVELLSGEERDLSSKKLMNRWRQIVGEIPGVSSLSFMSEWHVSGDDINVELSHEHFDTLLQSVETLKSLLKGYNGVRDIADSFESGKAELKLSLKDTGRNLGLTLSDLARQVRQGF